MQMDPALRHRSSYSTRWRSVRGIERRERGESVKNLLDFCHGTVTMSCPRNSQGCRKRIRKLLLTRQGSGPSLQAVDYKEVRQYPSDGVGIRLPVRTEAQGWNGLHPCRIGRHDFLERLAPSSRHVDARDLHRNTSGAYQEAFAAVEDETGVIDMVVFHDTYARVKDWFTNDALVMVTGRVDRSKDICSAFRSKAPDNLPLVPLSSDFPSKGSAPRPSMPMPGASRISLPTFLNTILNVSLKQMRLILITTLPTSNGVLPRSAVEEA